MSATVSHLMIWPEVAVWSDESDMAESLRLAVMDDTLYTLGRRGIESRILSRTGKRNNSRKSGDGVTVGKTAFRVNSENNNLVESLCFIF